jgi:hypothetical protein
LYTHSAGSAVIVALMLGITADQIALVLTSAVGVSFLAVVTALAFWLQ